MEWGLLVKEIERFNVMLIGCGLGQYQTTKIFLKTLLVTKSLPKLVLDADALNIISLSTNWWLKLPDDAIITPHPGEMARLLKTTNDEVQADRLGTAQKAAREWNKTVVLKGANTVIAAPDGRCRISPFANPGLASPGTGDVLAGVIAGLVAQGLSLFDAASLGVFLHGAAGEIVRQEMGDSGMLASDLLPVLPYVIKDLKEGEDLCS